MKAPHAILIGLSLIAAAIFFKDRMTPPTNALTLDGPDGFAGHRTALGLDRTFVSTIGVNGFGAYDRGIHNGGDELWPSNF